MRQTLTLVILLCTLTLFAFAQGDHEYAPIKEQKIDYNDWTYKQTTEGAPVNLRQWAQGNKLALVVYLAPWCHNSHNEPPVLGRLDEKYHPYALAVLAARQHGTPPD